MIKYFFPSEATSFCNLFSRGFRIYFPPRCFQRKKALIWKFRILQNVINISAELNLISQNEVFNASFFFYNRLKNSDYFLYIFQTLRIIFFNYILNGMEMESYLLKVSITPVHNIVFPKKNPTQVYEKNFYKHFLSTIFMSQVKSIFETFIAASKAVASILMNFSLSTKNIARGLSK